MGRIVVADLRGGRNGVDSPLDPSFYPNQCVAAINVDWSQGPLGRKRGGAAALSLAGGTAPSAGGPFYALFRHIQGGSEANSEMWAMDSAYAMKRMVAGVWADVTTDGGGLLGIPSFASFNGKLFIATGGGLGANRMFVYDPSLAAPRIRYVGINPGTTAATVANQGVGAYAAILRYYRVRFIQISGAVLVRRSEPTPSVSFTPSGAGLYARVTRPTAPGEGETHWELEASTDNVNFYQILGFNGGSSTAIATTFVDDGTATTSYTNGTLYLSDPTGYYTLPTACRYIVTDNNRLIMAGAAVSGPESRVWYTPVLGSLDAGDDERYINTAFQKGFLDLSEKDGGSITGMSNPIDGIIYVFKAKQIWRLTPTGDSDNPYLPRRISNSVGCVDYRTIVTAEDANGNPFIYFLSRRGPYRIGPRGLEYLGRDLEDRTTAMGPFVGGHAVYYEGLGQVWFWVSYLTSVTVTEERLIFHTRSATARDQYGVRGGWSIHTGPSTIGACSCMFANTPASSSVDLKPYVGQGNASPIIWKCDTADKDDAGTAFQAYCTTHGLRPVNDLGTNFGVREPMLVAKPATATTIELKLIRDFGLENTTSTVVLTAAGAETRVFKKFDGTAQSDIGVLQAQIGDSAAVASAWSLDALVFETSDQGER